MAKSWMLTTLLVLSIAAVTNTQYFDFFQGLQQLFQPYQPYRQNFDDTRRTTNRDSNKQNRTKTGNEQKKIKKQPTNQYDYLFSTTVKPSRKTTKISNKVINNNNQNNEYFYFELTTKSNRNKVPTTTNSIKSGVRHRTTTEIYTNINHRPANSPRYDKSETHTNGNDNYNTNRENVNNEANLHTDYVNTNFNRDNKVNSSRRVNAEFGNVRPPTWGIVASDNKATGTDTTSSNKPNKMINQNISRDINNRGNNWGIINNNNNRAPNTDYITNFETEKQPYKQNFNNENRGFETDSRNVNVAHLNNERPVNTNVNGNNNKNIDFNMAYTTENINRRVISSNFAFTTQNPLLNRPGVKPVNVDHGRPPITNKPDNDNIYFPNSEGFVTSETPDLLIGPDEDDMTSLQKRRYVDLAEKMCDRYKALNVKKVVALPLVPSPSPVEFNVTSCNPISIPLVIGGKVVNIKEFPHMSLVGWMKTRIAGYAWKCGGSLISDQYVLTAGHCTYQDKDYDVVSGPPQAVQLGSSYLDDPGALVVKVSAVIRHPKYKMRRSYHDIALIKLVQRVTFSEVIKPACLGAAPPAGNNIVATGWGRTEFGGDHSHELRSVSLPVWNIQECREIWGTSLKLPNGPTPDSHMCAGEGKGGKDTCQGDSGGPAQIQDGCVWRIVAVTSYGRSCGAPQTPALYAVIPKAFVAAQVFGDEVDYGGRGDEKSNRRSEEYYRNR